MIHIILLESAEVSVLTESSASDVVPSLLAREKEGALNSLAAFSQQPDKAPDLKFVGLTFKEQGSRTA